MGFGCIIRLSLRTRVDSRAAPLAWSEARPVCANWRCSPIPCGNARFDVPRNVAFAKLLHDVAPADQEPFMADSTTTEPVTTTPDSAARVAFDLALRITQDSRM